MNYYVVHLPISLRQEYHYRCEQSLAEGTRVLVSFNRRDMIGICGKACSSPPDLKVRFKPVLEVLDARPVLSSRLLRLAEWMASYYQCSVGSACFAMLPAWLTPDIDAEVRWLGSEIPDEYTGLHSMLSDGEFHKVSELRKALKGVPVLRLVETGEEAGYLELKRKLSAKDKPRILNYIKLLQQEPALDNLPARQKEAMQIILAQGEDLPLAELAQDFSWSVFKALAKKGLISIYPRKIERSFFRYDGSSTRKKITLNGEQTQAVDEISSHQGGFHAHLLYGITGSGKTEVYISMIRRYLREGKGVIFLIPEIALTPQMVERFQAEFGEVLAISHSQLSDRQRLYQWRKICRGECRIVIGARSAVFAPMPNLGLIVVDEEHEQSYKQDNNPRYNGRDLAVMRAKLEGAQIILGSATPSLESWHNHALGKYTLHRLNSRPLDYALPEVGIIDLCDVPREQLLSDELLQAISTRLERKEQVILFQNRRGFSSFIQCLKCGELVKCGNCEISMYYHRDQEQMQCHYCGLTLPSPRKCPHCGSFIFSYGAPGTQKVEQVLRVYFPNARILRLDSDSARKPDSHKNMYKRMKNKEVDILLGTQMISKGLDFPCVTLVGIINADISLNVPDFRSAERTFQLITQVAGRSGRGDKAGEVLIQTYNPRHYAIQHASRQDFPSFAQEELSYRQRMNYPPYYRLARILYLCTDEALLTAEMHALAQRLQGFEDGYPDQSVFLLGPAPAPLTKVRNNYRYHLIIKLRNASLIPALLQSIRQAYKLPRAITEQIDVDPLSLM
jgi:primosomal protein N' (replication factor Y)